MTPFRSKTGRGLAVGLPIFLLVATLTCRADTPAKVDKLFAQWTRADSPGAAVVIVKDGAIVYQHGYGCADLEHHVPNTPQTLFDIASLSKQFTGLSVAMLVHQGRLSLDDDIHKYLPDLPDFGKPITINNLVRHTSGLRDWPETLMLSEWYGPITLDVILEMVRRQRELDFAPGDEEQYSNTGYNLLAAAIARITGQSFRSWTEKTIFQPLGMTNSMVCDDPAEVINNCANSYAPAGDGKFQRVVSQLSAEGSSSIFMSAEDMGKWLLNFESGRVGGKDVIQAMQQPGKLNNGTRVDYGFGLGLGVYHRIPRITHGGSWAGYRSFMMWMPEKRFAIAILANTSDMDTYDVAMNITSLYLDIPAPAKSKSDVRPSAAFKPDPSNWNAILGTYRLAPGQLVTITREGDQLLTQATHEEKLKVTQVSETNFWVETNGPALTFVRDDAGAVKKLSYHGINAEKLTVPELTPSQLAAYTGDYWSEELGVVAHLEVHDGRLARRSRFGTWIILLPTGTDVFDSDAGEFSVRFTRNAASEVIESSVSGNRVRNIRYRRITLPKAQPAAPAI